MTLHCNVFYSSCMIRSCNGQCVFDEDRSAGLEKILIGIQCKLVGDKVSSDIKVSIFCPPGIEWSDKRDPPGWCAACQFYVFLQKTIKIAVIRKALFRKVSKPFGSFCWFKFEKPTYGWDVFEKFV